MRIGVPAEIKIHEYRVGLMPASVRELVQAGHTVSVQTGAGPASARAMRTTARPGPRWPPMPRRYFRAAT